MLFKVRSTKEAVTMPSFAERLKKLISYKFDQESYSTLPYYQSGLFTGSSLKESTDSFILRAL